MRNHVKRVDTDRDYELMPSAARQIAAPAIWSGKGPAANRQSMDPLIAALFM